MVTPIPEKYFPEISWYFLRYTCTEVTLGGILVYNSPSHHSILNEIILAGSGLLATDVHFRNNSEKLSLR